MKLAFVVQRYGLDIAGGAEYHCRLIAEHLARHAEVEVFTTCARDYLSWANDYPPGLDRVNGIAIHRFPVERTRVLERFRDASRRVFEQTHDEQDEWAWLDDQGPYVPQLIEHLRQHRDAHDLFVFFSYRYYPACHGVRALADKAVLVPTAEDDGIYRLSIFPALFRSPRAIVYNSVEERELIRRVSENGRVPGAVVGVGSELPPNVDPQRFRQRYGIHDRFALYVGRVDLNKGCPALFDLFGRYRAATGSSLRLALIGQAVLPVPHDPAFVALGFLPDADKWDAFAAADLVIMPSRYESLSMVTLEAWWSRRPVLVNGHCDVLRGQCRRSHAGLYYSNEDEFREALGLLERDEPLRRSLGENGRRYFEKHYAWDVIERKYLDLLGSLVGGESLAGRAVG